MMRRGDPVQQLGNAVDAVDAVDAVAPPRLI
jgi:hypothetical protein